MASNKQLPNSYFVVIISITSLAMITYTYCPKCRSEAKRSDVPYGHASMLLLKLPIGEATEPYNKYANLFK